MKLNILTLNGTKLTKSASNARFLVKAMCCRMSSTKGSCRDPSTGLFTLYLQEIISMLFLPIISIRYPEIYVIFN